MITRSGKEYLKMQTQPQYQIQTPKKVQFDINIDFDDASNAWKLNKKSIGNGCYKYKCIKINKNGNACKNESLYNCNYCRYHINCKNLENQLL
jgi:hypothetical protein